jgi:hypothetical protein
VRRVVEEEASIHWRARSKKILIDTQCSGLSQRSALGFARVLIITMRPAMRRVYDRVPAARKISVDIEKVDEFIVHVAKSVRIAVLAMM